MSAEPPAGDDDFGPWLAERLRRVALGLTAALITARAYWPSEHVAEDESGNGLGWTLALLVAVGLAVASFLIGGRLRLRWSWADLAFYALVLCVGLSSTRGADRRLAINLAWEWVGVGLAYALARNLPRTKGEASALAGALVATAVAVSAYGLYQVRAEFPALQDEYRHNPAAVLQKVNIDPASPLRRTFEDRLLNSNEPFSTFALANSLAGFLVGPTVLACAVALEGLRRREGEGLGSCLAALGFAAVPGLILLSCLLLTKSRSAYVGLAVGLAVLAWRQRGRLPTRVLVLGAAGLAVVLGVLIAAAAATRHLDLLVLTESTKSLRYRAEYWRGSWGVITQEPGVFLRGVGPGNFAGPYLRHKLPASSEEILDPHNMVLDVWATAGLGAMLALVAALGLALRDLLGPPKPADGQGEPDLSESPVDSRHRPADAPAARSGWLVACAGGGWLMVWALGQLDPFRDDLFARWLILGASWLGAVLFGLGLWRRQPTPAAGLGAAALAVAVNLLAAGGISMAAVSLALWTQVALGLDLRDDRPCGRLRDLGGRPQAFALAAVWAALVGSFVGAVTPYWQCKQAMAEADEALKARPPDFQRARDAYSRAHRLDRYSVRPWIELAALEYQQWLASGAERDFPVWKMIGPTLEQAARRNPDSVQVQKLQAAYARNILARIGSSMSPTDALRLRGTIVAAARRATHLYPTSAALHAELAQESAALGDLSAASEEAREALRLDQITPHRDKKLDEAVRKRLREQLPRWERRPTPAE